MKLGILSETHGSVLRTRTAIGVLMAKSIGRLIHCGDIGSESVLVEILSKTQPLGIPVYAVLGNVDFQEDEFLHMTKAGEFEVLGRFGELTLAEKRLAIVHGDNTMKLSQAISSGEYDYIFTGHTHKKEDRQIGKTRLINPGAVYRASQPTVAALDLSNDTLEFVPFS